MKLIEHYRLLKENVGVPTIFLLWTLLFAGIISLVKFEIIKEATPVFFNILNHIWLIIIFVFALLFLSNLFLTPKAVKGWLSHASGWKGWFLAVGGGILSSGPIYLWYPLLSELAKHGMRPAFTAVFLYNRAVKPALLPLLIVYFGVAYTIILTIYMIIFSVIQGIIIERFVIERSGERRE